MYAFPLAKYKIEYNTLRTANKFFFYIFLFAAQLFIALFHLLDWRKKIVKIISKKSLHFEGGGGRGKYGKSLHFDCFFLWLP